MNTERIRGGEVNDAALEVLGLRAKKRRVELDYSRKYVAGKLDIRPTTLSNWETKLKTKPRIETEALWEEVLEVPSGWLRNLDVETPERSIVLSLGGEKVFTAQDEIELVACWLAKKQLNMRTFCSTQLSSIERRNAKLFSLRYGCGGGDLVTLESIGKQYGLTRERVRQITDKMLSRLVGVRIESPKISRLRGKIQGMLPSSIESVDEQFERELGEKLLVIDLNRFCNEVLGKALIYPQVVIFGAPKNRQKVVWADALKDSRIEEELRLTRSLAVKMISNVGAAHIETLLGVLSKRVEAPVSYNRVVALCRSIEGFKWLREGTGWFWFGTRYPKRSRLINASKKVLTVAAEYQDKSFIHDGFLRTRRQFSQTCEQNRVQIEMPLEILGELLKRHPDFEAKHYDDFALRTRHSWREVLGSNEYIIASEIEKRGGVTSRRHLFEELVTKEKMTEVSLQIVLTKSPVITYIQRGIYALRGIDINPRSLATAIEEHNKPQKNSAGQDIKISEEGDLEFLVNAGVNAVKAGSIVIPTRVATHIKQGDYLVRGENRYIRVKEVESGATYARLLLSKRKDEIEIGDVLKIRVLMREKEIEYELNKVNG